MGRIPNYDRGSGRGGLRPLPYASKFHEVVKEAMKVLLTRKPEKREAQLVKQRNVTFVRGGLLEEEEVQTCPCDAKEEEEKKRYMDRRLKT